MTGKPAPAAQTRFEVATDVDITKLPLTPEEGFVLSRLMGRPAALETLVSETGMTPPQIKAHLESMMRKGAITISGEAPTPATRNGSASGPVARAPKDPYEGIIFSPADFADGKDLTDDQKKRILFVEMHLDDWNHYRLLDIRRSATGADIKTGYFKVSKEFHPDTFFRKDIGRYAERIDRIFRAMKAAYDVLLKPITRAAYDQTLVGELSEEELEELSQIADVKRREKEHVARLARAEASRKASRLRWNPLAKRLAQARELYRLAEEARKAGRIDEAATHARLACTYDEALKVRAEPILLEADANRSAVLMKKVQAAIQYGDKSMEADIKKAAEEAATFAEGCKRPALMVEAAKLLLQVKLPQRAFRLANMAAELDNTSAAAWQVVAEAAIAEEKWALATRAAERWLAIDPTSAAAKDIVKRAKDGRG